jgi:hypothetical protein
VRLAAAILTLAPCSVAACGPVYQSVYMFPRAIDLTHDERCPSLAVARREAAQHVVRDLVSIDGEPTLRPYDQPTCEYHVRFERDECMVQRLDLLVIFEGRPEQFDWASYHCRALADEEPRLREQYPAIFARCGAPTEARTVLVARATCEYAATFRGSYGRFGNPFVTP